MAGRAASVPDGTVAGLGFAALSTSAGGRSIVAAVSAPAEVEGRSAGTGTHIVDVPPGALAGRGSVRAADRPGPVPPSSCRDGAAARVRIGARRRQPKSMVVTLTAEPTFLPLSTFWFHTVATVPRAHFTPDSVPVVFGCTVTERVGRPGTCTLMTCW